MPTLPDWMGPRCLACERRGEPFPDRYRVLDLGEAEGGLPLADGFLVVSPAGGFRVCDFDGRTRREFPGVEVGTPRAVSPDGRHLVSYLGTGRLRVCDTASGAVLTEQRPGRVRALRFSPCGAMLAVTFETAVAVYDVDREIGALHARPDLIDAVAVAWSAGGRMAVSRKYGMQMLDEDGEGMWVEVGSPARVSGPYYGSTWREKAASPPVPGPTRFTPDGDGLRCLRFAPSGASHCFTAVSRYDFDGERWAKRTDVPIRWAERAELSPDARWAVTCGGLAEVTDLESGQALGAVGWGEVQRATFLPDGQSLLILSGSRLRVVPWARLLGVTSPA